MLKGNRDSANSAKRLKQDKVDKSTRCTLCYLLGIIDFKGKEMMHDDDKCKNREIYDIIVSLHEESNLALPDQWLEGKALKSHYKRDCSNSIAITDFFLSVIANMCMGDR